MLSNSASDMTLYCFGFIHASKKKEIESATIMVRENLGAIEFQPTSTFNVGLIGAGAVSNIHMAA